MRLRCSLTVLAIGCSDGKVGVCASGGSPREVGADIAAWARGPGAWRLQGTVEQNVVFHVMARALGLAD